MGRHHVSSSRGTGPRHARPHPYARRWIASLLAVLLGIVIFAGTASALVYRDFQSAVHTDSTVDKLLKRTAKPHDSYDGRAINVLVLGTDTRHGEGNEVDDNDDPTQRADTAMVVHLSKDRTRAQIVSVPRDTLVDIPSCKRQNGTHSRAQHAQFNWAYSLGGQDGSPSSAIACTLATVQKFSGLYIDDFILVDFNGFHHMVDALGGVNVYVDHKISDKDYSQLQLEPGCVHMNGDTALKYSRVRHGVKGGDGSDIQRIGRQQHMMSIMFRTAKQKNLFTDLPALYQFGRAGLASLTTSSGLSSLSTMAGLAYSLRNIDPHNIVFVTTPVVPARKDPNRVEFVPAVNQIWQALKDDRPLPAGLAVADANGNRFTTQAAGAAQPQASSPAPQPQGEDQTQKKGKQAKVGKRDAQAPQTATPQPTDPALEAARAKCEPK